MSDRGRQTISALSSHDAALCDARMSEERVLDLER
jgi:hypothetical protein